MAFITQFQYQPQTEPVYTGKEIVTESRWHQPWSEPVRQKVAPQLAIALMASGLFFTPQTAGEIVNVDKWYAALSEPVRIKPGLRPELQQVLAQPDPLPRVSFAWFDALSDPVRIKPGLRPEHQQALALYPTPSPFVATGWFGWLSEPVRIKPGVPAGEQQAFAFNPLPRVSFSWFNELSKPPKLDRVGLAPSYQQTLTFNPLPRVSFGWFGNLSEPVRVKPGLLAARQQFFAADTTVVPTTKQSNWYAPFSDPVRIKPGLTASLQQFLAWPPRLLPTPSITGTMSALETKDTFLGGASVFNRPESGELGVQVLDRPSSELGVSNQVAAISAKMSIRII